MSGDSEHVRLSREFFKSDPDWLEGREFSRAEAWIDVLQMVVCADCCRRIGLKSINLRRGEVLLSVRALAKKWNWSAAKVSRWLAMCQETKRLAEQRRTTEGNIYILEKYEPSQAPRNTNEHTSDSKVEHTPAKVKEEKREAKPWLPSKPYTDVVESYKKALPDFEAKSYFPSRTEEILYFKKWNELKELGLSGDEAHRLLVASAHGWAFDDWPDRKQPSAHRLAIIWRDEDSIRKFAALHDEDDKETDRLLAEAALYLDLEVNPDHSSN